MFSNEYVVSCILPHSYHTKNQHVLDESLCMIVSITLEYEHFDAFGMESRTLQQLDFSIVKEKKFCATSNPNKNITADIIHTRGIGNEVSKGK